MRKKKFTHQIHEKFILRELEYSEENWPDFSEDLDTRVYYLAHYQIWKAISSC